MTKSMFWGSAIVVAAWYVATFFKLVSRLFLPPPFAVVAALVHLIVAGGICIDFAATLYRTLTGFVLGSLIGIIIGVIMGYFRIVYQFMEFPVDFFRSIPATALFPLFIVIWGLGDAVKIFVAAWAAGMVVLINTIYGMRNVSVIHLMVAKTKKASPVKIVLRVVIPSAIPYIVAGLRIGLSIALVVEVVAEMFLGSHTGLGHRIFDATSVLETENAYASIILVGVLGYLLNKGIGACEHRYVHWSGH